MAKKEENVIAVILETIRLGEEFIEWPLHITIVPWFHGYDAQKLDHLLAELAAKHRSFSARVGKIERFGQKKDVAVNVIDDSPELINLHLAVFNQLEANGFIIHQKEYVAGNYRGHITRQTHAAMKEGQKIKIGSISLVHQERLEQTGEIVKTVIKNYELG